MCQIFAYTVETLPHRTLCYATRLWPQAAEVDRPLLKPIWRAQAAQRPDGLGRPWRQLASAPVDWPHQDSSGLPSGRLCRPAAERRPLPELARPSRPRFKQVQDRRPSQALAQLSRRRSMAAVASPLSRQSERRCSSRVSVWREAPQYQPIASSSLASCGLHRGRVRAPMRAPRVPVRVTSPV